MVLCMKTDNEHSHKLCLKNYLLFNNYKHGDGANNSSKNPQRIYPCK